MAVSPRLRFEILRRDGFACHYCHRADAPLHIDHVIAEKLGGTDDPTNLVAACPDCNMGKASTTVDAAMVADVNEKAQRWQQAMRVSAELATQQHHEFENEIERVDRTWSAWHYTDDTDDQPLPRPDAWRESVRHYLALGLPITEMERLVAVAMAKHPQLRMDLQFPHWRYYMGCCKNRLSEIEATARRLMSAQQASHDEARPTTAALEPDPAFLEPTLDDLP